MTAEGLKEWRKYAVVGIAFMAMILTPPDPISQLALGVPTYLLYEISIHLVAMFERKEKKRRKDLGLDDDEDDEDDLVNIDALTRIADALERISPPPAPPPDLDSADAYVWHPGETPAHDALGPVGSVNRIDLDLLQGIDRARDTLLENTRRFNQGMPANNVLLWGGAGHGEILAGQGRPCGGECGQRRPRRCWLVEVLRDDIPTLHRPADHRETGRGSPVRHVLRRSQL